MNQSIESVFFQPNDPPVPDLDFLSFGLVYKRIRGGEQLKPAVKVLNPAVSDILLQHLRTTKLTNTSAAISDWTILGDSTRSAGERGWAFQHLVLRHLLTRSPRQLYMVTPDGKRSIQIGLDIQSLQIRNPDDPPSSWTEFRQGTVVSHPRQGEHCADFIYYNGDKVIFVDTTVGDYRTKFPTVEDKKEKVASICAIVSKWLGERDYRVEVSDSTNTLTASKIPEDTERTRTKKRRRRDVPNPPKSVYFLLLSPRSLLKMQNTKTEKYAWVHLVSRTELVKTQLFTEEELQTINLESVSAEDVYKEDGEEEEKGKEGVDGGAKMKDVDM